MLKDRLRTINHISGNENVNALNTFLLRLAPVPGQIVPIFLEGTKDTGFAYHISTDKLLPKKSTTPTAADQIFNFDSPATYFHVGVHSYSKDGRSDASTLMFSNAVMIDVDNFPLSGLSSDKEKTAAIFSEYPILADIPPCYIVDTGKKGFQAYWIFGYNMLKKDAFSDLKLILNALLGGDAAVLGKLQSARLPYCRRFDGNNPKVIFSTEFNYSFFPFCGKIYNITKNYVVDYDRKIRRKNDESLFADDIQYTLKEYLINILGIKNFDKNFNKKYKEKELKEDWREQSKKALKKWKHKIPICEQKKESDKNKKKYSKSLSYFGKRKKDLFALLKYTKGNLIGYRNKFLFALAANERFMHEDPDEIDSVIFSANKMFKEPLPLQEVNQILKSAKGDKLYNYGGLKLGQLLPMYLLPETYLPYYPTDFELRKVEKENRIKKEKEQAKKKKELDFYNKFVAAAANETSVTKLASMLGISRPTVYKYLEKYKKTIKGRRKKAASIKLTLPKETTIINIKEKGKSISPQPLLAAGG